jgi:hypothetical protein
MDPEPVPTGALKKLRLPNDEKVSPALKELLAIDASWLGQSLRCSNTLSCSGKPRHQTSLVGVGTFQTWLRQYLRELATLTTSPVGMANKASQAGRIPVRPMAILPAGCSQRVGLL